jgi:hypothetical protein
MISCKKCRDLFLEGLYQNLDQKDQARLDAHLAACPRCASAYVKARRTLQIMDRRQTFPLPETYWEKNEWRILEKVQAGTLKKERPVMIQRTPLRWGIGFAAAAAILVIGIFIGRMTFTGVLPESGRPAGPASSKASFQFTELRQRTDQYLERSKVIILGLINFDVANEDPYILNIERNQKISGDLILEAGYLKENLDSAGENRLAELVSDLKIILMQIANLDRNDHTDGLELIKSGVYRNSLLMKIDVEKMRQTSTKGQDRPAVDIQSS